MAPGHTPPREGRVKREIQNRVTALQLISAKNGGEIAVKLSGIREKFQERLLEQFTFSRGIHASFTVQGRKGKPYKPPSLLLSSLPGALVFTFSRSMAWGCVPPGSGVGTPKIRVLKVGQSPAKNRP